jgi:hypothetical protein
LPVRFRSPAPSRERLPTQEAFFISASKTRHGETGGTLPKLEQLKERQQTLFAKE